MPGDPVISEALRQLVEGVDIANADRMLPDLDADSATRRPPGGPYSIATVVWHTWFWVNAWNVWTSGGTDAFGGYDPDASWPEVPAGDWVSVRDRLNSSLAEAARLAATVDADAMSPSGVTNGQNLLAVVNHTAYHFGQIALIMQELGLWPPPGAR